MTGTPSLFDGPDPSTLARTGDPETSHAAAVRSAGGRGSQRARLLAAFADHGPLTDEQAGTLVGIGRVADTRRCSELRRAGLILDTGERRATSTGSPAMVCAVTLEGLAALRQVAA